MSSAVPTASPPQTVIRTRILVLLLLLTALFAAMAYCWGMISTGQTQALAGRFLTTRQAFFQRVIDVKSERLAAYIHDTAGWDELVTFIDRPNRAWATASLTPVLEGLPADGMWVFGKQRQLLLQERRKGTRAITPDFRLLFSQADQKRQLYWFQRWDKAVWEFHAAAIHRSDDTATRGYYVIGRRLDRAYLNGLTRLADDTRVRLVPNWRVQSEGRSDAMTVLVPLRNLNGDPVAYLEAQTLNPVLSEMDQTNTYGLILFGIFSVGTLSLFYFILVRWVGRPILTLAAALHLRSPELLDTMRHEPTEFGKLAELIHAFFVQEKVLIAARNELEQRVAERTQELAFQAYHDTLTGLPNRLRFREELERATQDARHSTQKLAVLFLDVDNFKLINDSLGHEVGDQVLCAIARRMQLVLRSTDLVARLGGDEFAVLLGGIQQESQAHLVGQRLMDAFQEPLELADRRLFVTISVGISTGTGAIEPADLLRDADTAMYRAKSGGKAAVVFFDTPMKQEADERLELEGALRQAQQRGWEGFSLHYQPILDLATQRILGVEALLRWETPAFGRISPARFIPIAEESSLIPSLGEWTFQTACRQVELWNRTLPADRALYLSINLSARHLQDAAVVAQLEAALQNTQFPAERLLLEVTESITIHSPEVAASRLRELRSWGIQIAMDDFGTGYSSMSSLSELPIDLLKIDRSFVAKLTGSPDAHAIVQAIVELGHALGLKVVAEGIETALQLEQLQTIGCELGQGYLFTPPLAPAELERYLAEWHLTVDGEAGVVSPDPPLPGA